MHSFELSVIEYSPIIKDTRQLFSFLQSIYLYQPERYLVVLAIIVYLFDTIGNIGTLHTVIDGQFFALNALFPHCLLYTSDAADE